jgi:A/G-specific adenine glycosylase
MTTKPDRVKTPRAKTSVEARSGAAPGPLGGRSLAALRRALLGWYDEHRRDLPWRKTRDPYRIWVSEIMLQQTRVAAVLEHYRIFLERFPDIATLAAASEDAVLAAWSGLGYYRRARMLHQCAKEIASARPSRFPQSAKELEALPGIGRYTAAAIASIAFNEPVAVVDGNVERVLQRLTGTALSAAQNWQQAQSMLNPSRAGDSNQALMELGATVCVPREPHCSVCPVRKWCATRGEHPRTQRPPRLKKAQVWCSVDRSSDSNRGAKAGKIRLIQRPKHLSLMAGMWELPQSSEPPRPLPDSPRWRTFRHSITVTEYTVHVLRNTRLPGSSSSAKGKWIAIDRIPLLPLTGLTRKILKADRII